MVAPLNWSNNNSTINNIASTSNSSLNNSHNMNIDDVEIMDMDEFYSNGSVDIELSDINYDSTDLDYLTEEDLKYLVGAMSQEEYALFIEGIEKYYIDQVEYEI